MARLFLLLSAAILSGESFREVVPRKPLGYLEHDAAGAFRVAAWSGYPDFTGISLSLFPGKSMEIEAGFSKGGGDSASLKESYHLRGGPRVRLADRDEGVGLGWSVDMPFLFGARIFMDSTRFESVYAGACTGIDLAYWFKRHFGLVAQALVGFMIGEPLFTPEGRFTLGVGF